MDKLRTRATRALAIGSVAGLLAACAGGSNDARGTEQTRTNDGRRASDTLTVPDPTAAGESEGTGVGGAQDPTTTDTAGEYGDPNAWPTGPLPGDTGVGGAGRPIPDTVWMDTSTPADEDGLGDPDRDSPSQGGMPGGGTGPDVW